MAKSKNKRPRDASAIATDPLGEVRSLVTSRTNVLSEIEDRRQYHPERQNQPARLFSTRPAPTALVEPKKRPRNARGRSREWGLQPQTKAKLGFADPVSTVVCVRRHQRREVLHALKKLKGRGGSRRPPRKTWRSYIKC